MADKKDWELRTGTDVAEALDWLRRRMKGRGLVLLAIGTEGVAYAVDPKLSAFAAAQMVAAQRPMLERDVLEMQRRGVTRGASRREDLDADSAGEKY